MRQRLKLAVTSALVLVCFCRCCRAELVCGYQVEVIQFDAADGLELEDKTVVQMTSLNVGYGASGTASIDISAAQCIAGNCPIFLAGNQIDQLLPDILAGSSYQDVLCYFGPDLPCTSVPTMIRTGELSCGSPTLPETYTIAPFGLLVLGPKQTEPGTLYMPRGAEAGLEVNFFDSSTPSVLLRLEPPASDIVEVPEAINVIGANLGPGRSGVPLPVQCKWDDETSQAGKYEETMQLRGDN